MKGMIEQAVGATPEQPEAMPADPQAMAAEAPASEELTAESARAQMQLPEELKEAYVRVVDAGLKVMFDPSMRERTLEFMEGPGDPAEKMGEGIAAVMVLLFKESNETMPPQVIIPAGIELLIHAADVARKSGLAMTQDDVAEAIGVFVEATFRQFGTSLEEAGGMMQGAQPAAGGAV
jgi:hypothetical protein